MREQEVIDVPEGMEPVVDREPKRRRRVQVTAAALDRLPPHDAVAEEAVLACCLIDPQCYGDAAEMLTANDAFYDLRHRTLWMAFGAVLAAKQELDVVTVGSYLAAQKQLEEVGGYEMLAPLPDKVPSAANLRNYVEIVRDRWLERRMVKVMTEAVGDIYEGKEPVLDKLARIEKAVVGVSQVRLVSKARPVQVIAREAMEHLETVFSRGRKYRVGPQTPWNYLNNAFPGAHPGAFIIVAGRPGDGKSTVAMQMAAHAAWTEKVPTMVFTLEMTDRQLVERVLFQSAPANLMKFRNGFTTEQEQARLVQAAGRFQAGNMWIEDCPRLTVEDLELKVKRAAREWGIQYVVVDYLQRIYTRRNYGTRLDELNYISESLATLAKETKVVLVCPAQMNRDIEKTGDRGPKNRKPVLGDIKACGQIEADADIVFMLWKPKVEEEDADDMAWLPRMIAAGVPRAWTEQHECGGEPCHWSKHFRRVNLLVAKQREGMNDVDCALVLVRDYCLLVDAFRPGKVFLEDVQDAGAVQTEAEL